jgi:hypothetical protein
LLEDPEKEIISVLCDNIGIILNRYCNEHGFKYYSMKMKEEGTTPSSQGNGVSKNNFDFGTVATKNQKEEKKAGSKSADAKKQS